MTGNGRGVTGNDGGDGLSRGLLRGFPITGARKLRDGGRRDSSPPGLPGVPGMLGPDYVQSSGEGSFSAVIPAEAGIHFNQRKSLDSRFRGMTGQDGY